MHDVCSPKKVHFVAQPMEPVIEEVDADEDADPDQPTVLQIKEAMVRVRPLLSRKDRRAPQDDARLLHDPAAEVGDGVGEAINFHLLPARDRELETDEEKKYRD